MDIATSINRIKPMNNKFEKESFSHDYSILILFVQLLLNQHLHKSFLYKSDISKKKKYNQMESIPKNKNCTINNPCE